MMSSDWSSLNVNNAVNGQRSGRLLVRVEMSADIAGRSSVGADDSLGSRLRVLKRMFACRRGGAGVDGNGSEEGESRGRRWVIHPLSPGRCCYLMFIVVLTFVNLITIPLDLAFSEDMHGYTHKCWVAFNVFSDIMFCVDVAINFRMGTISTDGQVPVLDPDLIRKDYLRTWFIPDVVAAFPADIIIIIVEQNYHIDTSSLLASKMLRMLMFVRILSMIRLLRVPRLLRFCFELEHVSDIQLEGVRKSFRFVCALMMMFLIWHWNGCIQYFISVMEEFPSDCWVTKENLTHTSIGEKYSFALFRAFFQMTWISHQLSDPPTRLREQWTVVVSMVMGYAMWMAVIALLIVTFASAAAADNAHMKKMNQLKSSVIFRQLPKALRQRITAHYKWQFDQNNILDLMSKPLRKDIMAAMCSNLLRNGSLFVKCDYKLIEAILMKLEYEFFQAGDIIVHQGSQADRMFFIEFGRVLVETEYFQRELCCGDHFGEMCLFGGKQLATVRALNACRLFSLSVEKLQEIGEEFPDVVNDLRATAKQHVDDLERAELGQEAPSTSDGV